MDEVEGTSVKRPPAVGAGTVSALAADSQPSAARVQPPNAAIYYPRERQFGHLTVVAEVDRANSGKRSISVNAPVVTKQRYEV
jgi:hypothetical protein